MGAPLSSRTVILAAAALLALQALTLHLFGQPPVAAIGFRLWANNPLGPDNSQQLADWYSLSHIVHGCIFYGLARLAFPRLPVASRLLLALAVEAGWEIAENTPYVIQAYRAQALAAGYRGDSIVNSLSDSAMMMLGFFLASRLPWWLTLMLAVALEGLAAAVIRDNLTLNLINFAVSWPALEHWQAGYGTRHSLTLMAFVAQNDPPDRFVRLWRTAPHGRRWNTGSRAMAGNATIHPARQGIGLVAPPRQVSTLSP